MKVSCGLAHVDWSRETQKTQKSLIIEVSATSVLFSFTLDTGQSGRDLSSLDTCEEYNAIAPCLVRSGLQRQCNFESRSTHSSHSHNEDEGQGSRGEENL